jgi:putative ABC transport system permease protein
VGPSQVISISAFRVAQADLSEYRQGDYYDPGTAGAGNPQAPLTEQVTGLDETFLLSTRSSLAVRAPEYSSDADAWATLAKDSSLVILSGRYVARQDRRNPWPNLGPGDVLRLRNPVTGVVYEKRVIGRMAGGDISQGLLPGVMMRAQAVEQEFSSGAPLPVSTYLLSFAPGADQKALANSIEKELIAQGAQVFLVREWVERFEGFLQSFLRIAEGFLAFGLVVGVAGLAVVATRAVFQRRREIGTLRALGFQRRMVLGYFLVEASLISALGILLGIAAGTLSGYGVYLQQLKDEGLAFVWPVLELALIAALIWVASLIFTFLPARHAASLEPVEALRPVE